MKLLAPFIFALLVLVQAMPALGAASCAGPVVQGASCPCCDDCEGCAPAETLSCCCGRPAPADPALPTNDSGGKKLDPVVAAPTPAWSWSAPAPEPCRDRAARPRHEPRPARAPAQALLCIWVE